MSLELDVEGDIRVEGGQVFLLSGIEAIAQHLRNRLRTFAGEWFLDRSIGIPFFDDITKKNPDVSVLNAIFSTTILETPGVVSLNELNFDLNSATRELRITFSATTIDGELTESMLLGG